VVVVVPGLALAALVSAPAAAQENPRSGFEYRYAEQLVAYPGIGAQYADKIIASRPFKQRSELVSRKIMPSEVYLTSRTSAHRRRQEHGRRRAG
jgi:hypothetical protein